MRERTLETAKPKRSKGVRGSAGRRQQKRPRDSYSSPQSFTDTVFHALTSPCGCSLSERSRRAQHERNVIVARPGRSEAQSKDESDYLFRFLSKAKRSPIVLRCFAPAMAAT